MKIQHLSKGLIILLLTTGSAFATSSNLPQNNANGKSEYSNGKAGAYLVPEIDAASGTSAIALLAGILLLAGERYRSRRS